MKSSSFPLLALAFVTAGLSVVPATAQDLLRGETVLQRRRPEVEQLGVRLGSFLVLPRLEAEETYDSNVFATQTDLSGDWIFHTRPQIDIRSDWNQHSLTFSGEADVARNARFSSEDYNDYRFNLGGRFDVHHDAALAGEAFYRHRHESRGDPDQPSNYRSPVTYAVTGGEMSYTQSFNRLRGRLSASGSHYAYDNATQVNGAPAPQKDRDRWDFGPTARVGYEFIDGYEGFVQGTYAVSEHDMTRDYGGVDRDSTGYEAVVGTSVDLTGLVTGEFFLGYLTKNYQDSQLKDFSGLALGGRVNWAVTQLTTVTGSLTRRVLETSNANPVTGGGTASYERTVVALGVDHELLRSLLLNGRAQARFDHFTGISRDDDVYTVSGGLTYLINRNLYLTGNYTFERRNSTISGIAYSDHLVFLRLGSQF
jgi:hypothetical protein